jgi:LPXTG-motif cell wall-anchored protein
VRAQRRQQSGWRLAGLVSFAVVLFSLGFALSGTAGAAAKCPIGDFKNADGSIDTTGYLQCQAPGVNPNPVAPGGQVTVSAGGFKPGTQVTMTLVCPGRDPVVIGTTTADDRGLVKVDVSIPGDAPNGDCTIEVSGVDANGDPLTVSMPLKISSSATGTLPRTGSDVGQYVGLGLALVALGGAAVGGARRERLKRVA